MQTHTYEILLSPGFSFPAFMPQKLCMNVHTEQIWSFAFTDSLIFADMLPLTLKHFSLPHLFSFHQQDFKAHFVSSATVPPFLPRSFPSFPFSHSNHVPQLEVKSLAIPPPCFWPPLPSLSPSKLSATPSSASCFPSSPSSLFFASSACFLQA